MAASLLHLPDVPLQPRPPEFMRTGAAAQRIEICDYPDSGKFGVFDAPSPAASGLPPGAVHHFAREDQPVGYWEGE